MYYKLMCIRAVDPLMAASTPNVPLVTGNEREMHPLNDVVLAR